MDCPKCVGKLEKKTVENIEIDACTVCEGIWFDAGELEAVIKGDSKDFDYIDVGRESLDGLELAAAKIDLDSKKGKCPRCDDGTELLQTQYEKDRKVRVDICPKGHGLWLDGGEIKLLRKRGLVKLREHIELRMDIMRFAFSKDGFNVLRNKFRRKQKRD